MNKKQFEKAKTNSEILYREYKQIMGIIDGTSTLIGPAVITAKGSFSCRKARDLAGKIMKYLPGSVSPEDKNESRTDLYFNYLYMSIVLGYLQPVLREEYPHDDSIRMAGLGYDYTFGGLIKRAYLQNDFLLDKYGTELVTGKLKDYENSKLGRPDILLSGLEILVNTLKTGVKEPEKGYEYDVEADAVFVKCFPEANEFISAFERFKACFFETGARDRFQDCIDKAVRNYLISEGLSLYGEDVFDQVYLQFFKAERALAGDVLSGKR